MSKKWREVGRGEQERERRGGGKQKMEKGRGGKDSFPLLAPYRFALAGTFKSHSLEINVCYTGYCHPLHSPSNLRLVGIPPILSPTPVTVMLKLFCKLSFHTITLCYQLLITNGNLKKGFDLVILSSF